MRTSSAIFAIVFGGVTMLGFGAQAQSSLRSGTLPYGNVPSPDGPPAAGTVEVVPDVGTPLGDTVGQPLATELNATVSGHFEAQGWIDGPVTSGAQYGQTSNGLLFYRNPQTGMTQYYGTLETRQQNRFVPQ